MSGYGSIGPRFSLMTSLSLEDRTLLNSNFSIIILTLYNYKTSQDGTVKFYSNLIRIKLLKEY